MGALVGLLGGSFEFISRFADLLRDCGFDPVVGPTDAGSPRTGEVSIYEVADRSVFESLIKKDGTEPFLVYSDLQFTPEELVSLKAKGSVGAITTRTSPEDTAFLVNKALFYSRMLKRNPRVPVSLPVELSVGTMVLKTTASMLSRDGIFVITMNPLPVNSLCDLTFRLPGSEHTFKTVSRVLYNIAINKELGIIADPRDPFKRLVAHPGMAMLFVDMGVDERELIEAYIETIS